MKLFRLVMNGRTYSKRYKDRLFRDVSHPTPVLLSYAGTVCRCASRMGGLGGLLVVHVAFFAGQNL